ncbi:calcium-binding protein [Pseudomonas fluorescens]|uniref:calcium-binding protein n=1 Tax=Pseudomonas fluorescens TaxID=294 RepID=UPI00113136D0|nr:calcium-binding protein [Pseudomonas fluorescens]TMU71557.1 calcium-binding protein [Pseudomonas fluorescens]
MATLISEASIQTDPIVMTDMKVEANQRNASTIDISADIHSVSDPRIKSKIEQLKVTDSVFGPLQFGDISITRVSLDALGATIDGHPLNGQNTFFRIPKRSFINSLQFNASDIEQHIKLSKGGDNYLLPTLLFEMASRRPLTAPHMIRESLEADTAAANYRNKLVKLLSSAQRLDLRHAYLPKNNPRWVAMAMSYSTLGSSVGIQGFGIFMGLRGVVDAIKANNSAEIAINSVGIASELGSIAVDVAVSKIATEMLTAGQHAFKDFAKTRFALRLGRSGGLIGGALTLPFDIFTAVRSFSAAKNVTGKEAMDHYVSAGLSITSAAMTVILGTAAMAGFSFAGPVGLAAGAILAIGSQVYGAVRVVDDIDDYIELTLDERWRTGWFSFCMADIDQDVQDRYSQAKTRLQHSTQLRETAKRLLAGALKETIEAIVHGSFEVHMKPTQVWTRNWWTKQASWKTVNIPQVVGGDDTIDARNGVTKDTPGAVLGAAAENKGVLWLIGDGRDSIRGVEKKPNTFHYRSGRKELTGGEQDDRFVFESAGDSLKQGTRISGFSTLKAGAGNDTLVLGGIYSGKDRAGYDVDLLAQTLQTITTDPAVDDGKKHTFHSFLEGFENVETVRGADSVVTGTQASNIIISRGQDTINAGPGNDQIHLWHTGAVAAGEAGIDEYLIAHEAGQTVVNEDGEQESIVVLKWPMMLIESWGITNNSLVITSAFDFHDNRKNVVIFRDIYQPDEQAARLLNNKLTIITKDGFFLKPELPEKIATDKNLDIKAVIIKQGHPVKPTILYTPDCWIMHQNDARYYLPRSTHDKVFYSVERADAVTTLYLDYASTELTKVEAHFLARQSDKDHDLMAGCDLTYHLGEKTITLKYFAGARGGSDPKNMTKILRTMAMRTHHKYVLIFNDAVALNAGLTPETDVAPADSHYEVHSFKRWTTQMKLPLKLRTGHYPYDLPTNEAYKLSAKNGCAMLTSYSGQTAMESLEGEGSTYLVHLVANMTIKLSTPGALADAKVRLPYSSTWELDATALGKVEIKLENNQLHVGTCIVHLPHYESEDLIDQIRVITEKGVVHTVDLSFDRVYLDGLDARFFDEPDSTKALPEVFAPMANKDIKVRNIALADNRPGALNYSFAAHGWILRSDKSRIEFADLQVINRCSHQDPRIFTPPPLINVPPA